MLDVDLVNPKMHIDAEHCLFDNPRNSRFGKVRFGKRSMSCGKHVLGSISWINSNNNYNIK